uniref:Uncharacterized protein n=1 Tax=viral metagenome TaxID=1070528 RepID=A0A6M3LU04_9ZZZZ
MCRGCEIKLKPYSKHENTYGYLGFLDKYHSVIQQMKDLNKLILDFENDISDTHQRSVVSRFRRKLIKLQKEIAKADTILNGV